MIVKQRLADINAYLSQGIHSVNGWCVPQLWQTIWPLAQEIGPGPVAEIGVFEGKFLIGLCKTFGTSGENMATAIDVFDMQEFNLDAAGVGKLGVLKDNLDRLGVGSENLHYVRADSLSLKARDSAAFLDRTGPCCFFSVDGCHEVVHTIHDIEFALSVISGNGIIAVDDYTNSDWPGVAEAVARMYLMSSYSFVPLAVTSNKLLLCGYSFQEKYIRLIQEYVSRHHPKSRIKKVKRFGFDTLTVHHENGIWTDLA